MLLTFWVWDLTLKTCSETESWAALAQITPLIQQTFAMQSYTCILIVSPTESKVSGYRITVLRRGKSGSATVNMELYKVIAPWKVFSQLEICCNNTFKMLRHALKTSWVYRLNTSSGTWILSVTKFALACDPYACYQLTQLLILAYSYYWKGRNQNTLWWEKLSNEFCQEN